jgi:hypothetical protein
MEADFAFLGIFWPARKSSRQAGDFPAGWAWGDGMACLQFFSGWDMKILVRPAFGSDWMLVLHRKKC